MRVEFKESFLKDIRTIKDKSILARLQEIIELFEEAENLTQVANLKRLKGSGHYYRIRVGDYRAGLVVEGEIVTFVRAFCYGLFIAHEG